MGYSVTDRKIKILIIKNPLNNVMEWHGNKDLSLYEELIEN